ncbi:hypothetical protein BDV97DRAFT_171002 [Delphinella strobiligena]|nr:hypothetical protein BDV97DRAFT_171002 [Delphinella strobiligena]
MNTQGWKCTADILCSEQDHSRVPAHRPYRSRRSTIHHVRLCAFWNLPCSMLHECRIYPSGPLYGSIGASDCVASGNDKGCHSDQTLRCNPVKPWLTLRPQNEEKKNNLSAKQVHAHLHHIACLLTGSWFRAYQEGNVVDIVRLKWQQPRHSNTNISYRFAYSVVEHGSPAPRSPSTHVTSVSGLCGCFRANQTALLATSRSSISSVGCMSYRICRTRSTKGSAVKKTKRTFQTSTSYTVLGRTLANTGRWAQVRALQLEAGNQTM